MCLTETCVKDLHFWKAIGNVKEGFANGKRTRRFYGLMMGMFGSVVPNQGYGDPLVVLEGIAGAF